ncbi:MAG: hypothetical protein LUC31_01485 [Coprobacillus sp.]|nr:hypothetical protein [Coprobacillus sp.]
MDDDEVKVDLDESTLTEEETVELCTIIEEAEEYEESLGEEDSLLEDDL